MTRRLFVLLALVLAAAAPRPLAAQERAPSLESFVAGVARLWSSGNAGGIVDLAPEDGRIVLDVGAGGPGAVQARNAAAALRSLFGDRETVSVRSAQVTVAGGSPPRGFGELTWVSRTRGVSDAQSSVVYVGTVLEDGRWRIRELRILR